MKLPCNGCTACCQWGDAADEVKPVKSLKHDEKGNCVYLIEDVGCSVWGKPEQPEYCRQWSCQDLLAEFAQNPITRILIAAYECKLRIENGSHATSTEFCRRRIVSQVSMQK